MQAHLITILINHPRRCEREAIIMQMNDDFSTLNCFVSSLCWLHKYWRRSIFIYCNFVIVLHTKKKKGKEGRKGLETLSLCVDKLFHLVNPLIAGAARRGFVRKCLICFPPPTAAKKQLPPTSSPVNHPDLRPGRITLFSSDLNKLFNQMKVTLPSRSSESPL